MRFIKKTERWGTHTYVGRKNKFKFTYSVDRDKSYYVVVNHLEKDIRYNSMWENITFSTKGEVEQWCEDFKPENFNCIGKDLLK